MSIFHVLSSPSTIWCPEIAFVTTISCKWIAIYLVIPFMGILSISAWFSPLGWFSVWHPDLPWGSVRTLSWFSLPVSLLLLLSPLQKFSSYRNPHDYKAGVFKGSVLITLLSESIPSPQDRNHTLTTPYLYLWLDLPLEPMYPIAVDTWVYRSTTSPKELNIFSPLLLICCSSWTPWLSYWCQELGPSKSHCQELKRHPRFPFAYLDIQSVSEFCLFSA